MNLSSFTVAHLYPQVFQDLLFDLLLMFDVPRIHGCNIQELINFQQGRISSDTILDSLEKEEIDGLAFLDRTQEYLE